MDACRSMYTQVTVQRGRPEFGHVGAITFSLRCSGWFVTYENSFVNVRIFLRGRISESHHPLGSERVAGFPT